MISKRLKFGSTAGDTERLERELHYTINNGKEGAFLGLNTVDQPTEHEYDSCSSSGSKSEDIDLVGKV